MRPLLKRITSFLCSLVLATTLEAQQQIAVCGKEYRKQFDNYPLQEGLSDVKGKRDLEKRVIPYVLSGARDVAFVNLDDQGKDDYISIRSASRVRNCNISKDWLPKDNEVYVETEKYGGRTFSWSGDLIVGYERFGRSTILRVYTRDVNGKETAHNFNYAIVTPTESQKGF